MKFRDLGHISYKECISIQEELWNRVSTGEEDNTLLFAEYDPLFSLGINFHKENMLLSLAECKKRGIDVEHINRGGDVTYHGPGQLCMLPIFRMEIVNKDVHRWMRVLEEVIIQIIAEFGLKGYRSIVNTGCWVNNKKIASIGVKVRRGTSTHGVALNCNPDLEMFDLIVPCGLRAYEATSISYELGRVVTIEDVIPYAIQAFERIFSVDLRGANDETLSAHRGFNP